MTDETQNRVREIVEQALRLREAERIVRCLAASGQKSLQSRLGVALGFLHRYQDAQKHATTDPECDLEGGKNGSGT